MKDETITISSDELNVKINSLGAEIQSITNKNNTEFMWEGNPDIWSGKAPVLFPICGGLKNDVYTFDNKEYTLPKHGFARKTKFEIEKATDSTAVFLLKSTPELKKSYPFDFEFRAIFELIHNKLKITYNVKNTGEKAMYFSVGAHEAYACPEGIENYFVEFEKEENFNAYKLDGNLLLNSYDTIPSNGNILPLKEEYFTIDALVFKNINSQKVVLKKKNSTKKIELEFPNHNYFLIWHKYRSKYLCLEPWCGIQDIANTSYDITEKEGIISLEKHCEYNASHTIAFTE